MKKQTNTESKYIEQNITDTIENNYMPYAMSVIVSRAIPGIDGFKPSHRKLLYTMYKMGLMNGDRTKSTNVVGQTMKLNPHGDATIYETMVRLARGNEALLVPLVDSKGNFGKVYSKNMAFAASRYTEVRLEKICEEVFKDIDKNTVDMVDNYDGTMKEPVLFPTAFPNILANPNQGIAVSMASTICSFNLKEVCNATIQYIKNKNTDLLKYLKAPDFSTGGEIIYNADELRKIYSTGRGSFKVRAKYRYDKKSSIIEVYEIPYTSTIESIIDKVISLVKSGKIKEINDIRNETDLGGLKIAIDIKRSADPHKLMTKLYKMTPLCDSFNCNFNVLVNGSPRCMSVAEILDEWILFRQECIERKTYFEREKKKEKLHLLEGLSKIILDIDKAIRIVRNTPEDALVVPNLMEGFGIDRIQAEYVAEIKLRNLNKDYILKRTDEIRDLNEEIYMLTLILEDKQLVNNIIVEDLKRVSKKYGIDRKTDIISEDDVQVIDTEEFIDDYGVKLFLTKENYFKKITLVSLRSASEHKLKDDDEIIQELESTNKSEILMFSDKCNVYKVKLYELAECKASSLGDYLNNIIGIDKDEKIIYMTENHGYNGYMLFAYQNGKISKIDMKAYETKTARKKLINAYGNKSPIVNILYLENDEDILLVRDSDKAMLLNTSLIPLKQTKNSSGVQVYTLKKGSVLSAMLKKGDFDFSDIDYYRSEKIPATGHFITDEDKKKNDMDYQLKIE
ncbi:MAG: topoisomerase IV [Firmicutes bacterium]|nr:topoisomerase IV [Bacillota bacterium]